MIEHKFTHCLWKGNKQKIPARKRICTIPAVLIFLLPSHATALNSSGPDNIDDADVSGNIFSFAGPQQMTFPGIFNIDCSGEG